VYLKATCYFYMGKMNTKLRWYFLARDQFIYEFILTDVSLALKFKLYGLWASVMFNL